MNICIYGGTFDPIHFGHINMAEEAIKLYNLDKVFFIPSGNSYLKKNVTSAIDRYHMTELAIKNYSKFAIDDIELRRNGPSYSYETILDYKKKFPSDNIFFLIGEDSLRNIHIWRNVQIIFDNVTILVAGRKQKSDLDDIYDSSYDIQMIINNVIQKFNANIVYYTFDCNISSTQLKNSIYDHEFLGKWVPYDVIRYIEEHKLYN